MYQSENERYVKVFNLVSGFTIHVTPLPPYYKDIINERFPLPEYPKRKIILAAGDVIDWPYEPPGEMPDKTDEDYELYIKWHDVDRKRKEIKEIRNRTRVNYLLSMCVNVVDGPIDFEDYDEWVPRVEASFPDYQVPQHKGKRLLLFLKQFVVTTQEEMNAIIAVCTSPEVNMQGISSALRGFRD